VCERRDGKGKMTNVMASKSCAYLQRGLQYDWQGDSSQFGETSPLHSNWRKIAITLKTGQGV
jgi:hypothetical protein